MEDGEIRPTGDEDVGRRSDWERNHVAIQKCYSEKLRADGTIPSTAEIMAATGLGETAVKDHLRSLKGKADRFAPFRMLTEEVVMGMARAGIGGDARSGKFFVQFVEEWEEKKRVTQVNQNPYAALSDEDLRKRAEDRRASIAARKKALDAARNI